LKIWEIKTKGNVKLFIQLEIGEQKGSDRAWLHYASSLSSDIMGTDLDNHSDDIVTGLVRRLIDQADTVFLLVEVNDPRSPLGATSSIIQHCLQYQDRVGNIVLSGNHEETERLSGGFSEKFIKEDREENIKQLIKAFTQ